MSDKPKSLNDKAWEQLFAKYNILACIGVDGQFQISAAQIREFREPRLMAKFDHTVNLPKIFLENKLAILPITRGDYVISHFDAYHSFEKNNSPIIRVPMPTHIQSLDYNNLTSETIALNSAVATGIIADFLEDEELVATVSGRMGSGKFGFNIINTVQNSPCQIAVSNSQIEIDAAYEGVGSLALFEAKRDLSEDFLIRQLYYPYRVWQNRVTKPVRTLFLVYSNGVYRLYEYKFQALNDYNSLVLVQQKNYSVEDTEITVDDIHNNMNDVRIVPEPEIPFPQADRFERVINLCELLNEQDLSRNDVTEQYAFDVRQTNYYTDAARYLGLVEKYNTNGVPTYRLTDNGKKILGLNFKQRQLAYCKEILSHQVFSITLKKHLENGVMPDKNEIIQIMKQSNLYNIQSAVTFERRSSTVKCWVDWMVGLASE